MILYHFWQGFIKVSLFTHHPATDHFVVIIGTSHLPKPVQLTYSNQNCIEKAWLYKEYTTEMQPTGKFGFLGCFVADVTSYMIDNELYLVGMTTGPAGSDNRPAWIGWRLEKFDAVSWQRIAFVDIPLDQGNDLEVDDGPTISLINGQIDVTGELFPNRDPDGPMGSGSHHHFFTTDLQPLEKKWFKAPEYPAHRPEVSILQESNGDILMFTGTTYWHANLKVMRFDKDWNFIEEKLLCQNAFFPTGSASDGKFYYIAYSSQTPANQVSHNMITNAHLAAYDSQWNLVQDAAITQYSETDHTNSGAAWILIHGRYLYVGYATSPFDPTTGQDTPGQTYVNIYELTGQPVAQPSGQAGGCSEQDTSALGVLRSKDRAATWTSVGNACMQNLTVWTVDPTGFLLGDRVVLYFVDFNHLEQKVPQILYRATSLDGVHFDSPRATYTQEDKLVDPFVLPLADGSYRMYAASDSKGIISAFSKDGLTFSRDDGIRSKEGGMPGALLLPDGRVRLFLAINGIGSFISSDGINFVKEEGLRIPATPNAIVDNPQPIRLKDGSYLMLFQIRDKKYEGSPAPWEHTEIHLATSLDAFTWIVNPAILGYGGTSCLIEMPDGTLLLYYVNR